MAGAAKRSAVTAAAASAAFWTVAVCWVHSVLVIAAALSDQQEGQSPLHCLSL